MPAPSSSPSDKANPAGKNALEWSVFTISVLLVLGTFGVLVYGMTTWTDSPPRLVAKIGETSQESGFTWVPVSLTNQGDHVATNVEIEVVRSLSGTSGTTETATITLDQVPHGAERQGRVSFAGEKAGTFSVRVVGFQEP